MDRDYIEGRFGIVMEEVRDALVGIQFQLEELNKKLGNFEGCIEDRTPLRLLRVIDVSREPKYK